MKTGNLDGEAVSTSVLQPPWVCSRVEAPERCRIGSLLYTKRGLFTLFAWLLWGDFSFTLMETVWNSLLPLELRAFDAPNTMIALIAVTIPQAMNFVLNPIISTASDRHRGRRGRRIPFLMFATPFVSLFLVLLGLSRPISSWLQGWLSSIDPNYVTIGVIATLVIGFRFFELFINTIYWYLFRDVVPTAFLGRFLGLFRVVGTLAGAAYHYFVFQYAESHASQIFFGVALLYGVVFFLMCRNVQEGKYPPPEPMTTGALSPLAYLKAFGKDCFGHRMFVLVYLSGCVWSVGNCINVFGIFMATSLGLTLEQMGKIAASAAIATGLLSYPAGMLVDRLHPIRVMLLAKAGLCVVAPLNLMYLFLEIPPETIFWCYVGVAVITVPLGAIYSAATLPMLMRMLPAERFGQFSSANATCNAMALVAGSFLAGSFLDLVKRYHQENDFYYRFIPVWTTIFYLCSVVITLLLFLQWKKLGGDRSYSPPCSDRFKELYGSV